MRLVIALLSIALYIATAYASAGNPTYSFTLHKSEDSIAVHTHNQRTVFVITSESGIGKAEVNLKAGQWPGYVSVRFQYHDGRGFQSLEGFTLTTSRLRVQGGMDRTSGMFRPDRELSDSPEVNTQQRAGAVEVDVPADLLTGSDHIHFEWIDAYR